MTESSSDNYFDNSHYQTPSQDWVCGHQADGHACPIGPNGTGECVVGRICNPEFDGSAWHCTRAKAWGGKCQEGPLPDPQCPDEKASCPHQPPVCAPARSLRSKRRLVSGLAAAAALGCCLVILGGNFDGSPVDTSALVSPGPLSAHHATMEEGCAACHTAATESPVSHLTAAFGSTSGGNESHHCLKCHQEKLGENAMHVHSMSPDRLMLAAVDSRGTESHTLTQTLARAIGGHASEESGELACSTCHREHRGAKHDLTQLTNSQCQTCHSNTFHSFADGHPAFPQNERSGIHFDHISHMELHFNNFERLFPEGIPRTQCGDCHTPAADGNMMTLASYEVMCGSCHEHQIRDFDDPLDFSLHQFQLLDLTAGPSTERSSLPPFMELLMNDDAESVDELLTDLQTDAGQSVLRRLQNRFGESSGVEEVVDALTGTGFFRTVSHALQSQPESEEFASSVLGNWRLTDAGRVVYRTDGHADPLLRTLIDLTAARVRRYPEAPGSGRSGAVDRLFHDLASPGSTGRCLKCHTIGEAADISGLSLSVNWKTEHGRASSFGFTRFSHKPHLTLLSSEAEIHALGSNNRCESCHDLQWGNLKLFNEAFIQDDGMPSPVCESFSTIGVNSARRQDCAKCHTPQLAGDNCLQCHDYHVHP